MPMMSGLQMRQPQQPMFGQRPPAAQMPQITQDPFVQAWQQQAMTPPRAPMPQAQPQAQPQPGIGPAPDPNDPTAPVAITPQQGTASGGGDMDKLMSLLKMFGVGA